MADYFTESELEARLSLADGYFNDSPATIPTSTVVGTIIIRASRMVDALTREAEDTFGSDPSKEDVKTAALEIGAAIIEGFWFKEKRLTSKQLYELGKTWLGTRTKPRRSLEFSNSKTSQVYTE